MTFGFQRTYPITVGKVKCTMYFGFFGIIDTKIDIIDTKIF